MRKLLYRMDDFLRMQGIFSPDAQPEKRLMWLLGFVIVCGLLYGMVMGTYSGISPGRYQQLLYSAVKVPLLLLVTFGLCLPSFFVINTVVGLRDDFSLAVHALIAAQAGVTMVLACLAPVTAFLYISDVDYHMAIGINGVVFAVASLSAQIVVRRYYRVLIARSPRHRYLLWAWIALYGFVGIQMGWVLRPFIGNPMSPVAFYRPDAWGNAYVVIIRLILDIISGH